MPRGRNSGQKVKSPWLHPGIRAQHGCHVRGNRKAPRLASQYGMKQRGCQNRMGSSKPRPFDYEVVKFQNIRTNLLWPVGPASRRCLILFEVVVVGAVVVATASR